MNGADGTDLVVVELIVRKQVPANVAADAIQLRSFENRRAVGRLRAPVADGQVVTDEVGALVPVEASHAGERILGRNGRLGQGQEGEVVVRSVVGTVVRVHRDVLDVNVALAVAGDVVVVFSDGDLEGLLGLAIDAVGRGEDVLGRNEGSTAERDARGRILDEADVEGDGVRDHVLAGVVDLEAEGPAACLL